MSVLRFRCERCGYSLKGLGADALCPECARPLADSRPESPESHPGSPWQQAPGLRSWVRTLRAVMLRPTRTFAALRMDPRAWRGIFWLNMLAASLIFLGVFAWCHARGPINLRFTSGVRHQIVMDGTGMWSLGLAVLSAVVIPPLLPLAALLSRTARAARMSALAVRVCNSHVTFPWVVAALAWTAGVAIRRAALPGEPIISPTLVAKVGWIVLHETPAILLFLSVGLLAWIDNRGTRACRFANSPGAGPGSEASVFG